jgi:hypothetical protein
MSPPEKKEGGLARARSSITFQLPPSLECQRGLELLCAIIRSLACLGDKLDDIAILNQQTADLLRRIIKERAL